MLGSVMWSKLIPRIFCGVDITEISDDANPGTTNVIKHAGPLCGAVCMALDFCKGFLPVFVASKCLGTDNLGFSAVIAAPVLGSVFSPFLKGYGAKSITVSFGCMAALLNISPVVLIFAGLLIFFSSVVVVYPDSLRLIVTSLVFIVFVMEAESMFSVALACTAISVLLVFSHLRAYNYGRPTGVSLFFGFLKRRDKAGGEEPEVEENKLPEAGNGR